MVRDSLKWKFSDEKCCEIVHLTIIDLLNEKKNKTLPLNELVILMNSRTRLYKISNHKKYNSFSKYLKLKHGGFVNFVENYNIYGIIKTDKQISVRLYPNLVELANIKNIEKRITKDSEWTIIDDDY